MWGVASLPELSLGTQTDMTEPIYLLRAMAKVRVGMRSDMPSYGYSIGSMHINNYNTKGYCLPNNYKLADRTQDIRFDNSLHVFDSREASIDLVEERATYITEYDNTSSGATPATITINLNRNGKHEGTYTLYFSQLRHSRRTYWHAIRYTAQPLLYIHGLQRGRKAHRKPARKKMEQARIRRRNNNVNALAELANKLTS